MNKTVNTKPTVTNRKIVKVITEDEAIRMDIHIAHLVKAELDKGLELVTRYVHPAVGLVYEFAEPEAPDELTYWDGDIYDTNPTYGT